MAFSEDNGAWIPDPITPEQELANLKAQMEMDRLKREDLAKQGLNPDGSPIRPEFESLIDENGNLKSDNYKLKLDTLDPNSLQGYNMIKALATQKGPTESAKYMLDQNKMNQQNAIDQASQQQAGSQAAARSALAMRGGMSSGARERLAMGGARDLLNAKQGAVRSGNQGILDILKSDEDAKRQAMYSYAQGEGQIAGKNLDIGNQAKQYNLGTVLKEKDLGRQQTMDTYKAELDKWAAGRQADATRASGGGGK